MSKEVKRWDELKALAEGMDGWPNKNAFECDDAWCVGAIDEMAKYYAAANPPAILDLLAERDALLAERDALRKDSERYQLLASTMVADCLGKDKTPQQAALFTTLNTITHVGTEAEFDAVFDAALKGEQP